MKNSTYIAATMVLTILLAWANLGLAFIFIMGWFVWTLRSRSVQ